MMERKECKRQNRLRASEEKLGFWYFSNTKNRLRREYYLRHGNPWANRNARLIREFTNRYAKPAYDALVSRMVEHKQEVKNLCKKQKKS